MGPPRRTAVAAAAGVAVCAALGADVVHARAGGAAKPLPVRCAAPLAGDHVLDLGGGAVLRIHVPGGSPPARRAAIVVRGPLTARQHARLLAISRERQLLVGILAPTADGALVHRAVSLLTGPVGCGTVAHGAVLTTRRAVGLALAHWTACPAPSPRPGAVGRERPLGAGRRGCSRGGRRLRERGAG